MSPARRGPDVKTYVGRFATRLRKLREDSGMTQDEFAEKVSKAAGKSVSVMTVYAWENGNSTPNIKMLPNIAKALKFSPARDLLPPR